MKPAAAVPASCVLCLVASTAFAQTSAVSSDLPSFRPAGIEAPSSVTGGRAASGTFETQKQPAFFNSIGRDLSSFFSTDTAKIVGSFAFGGLAVMKWDGASVDEAREMLPRRAAGIGNLAGSLLVQAGAGVATDILGHAIKNRRMAELGSDLIRAQVLSQILVQGTKFSVGRLRPDGSDSQSFPSGHTASAFATATVVQQHFGWKAGVPAYAFAAFVGESRMASNKHYLTDVMVGAGIGIAAGRTVTLRLGREEFGVGVAPTRGGAMVSFTKQ
jgi:membrane-associated phospholipid phosphatase